MEERLPCPRLYRKLNEYCRSDAYPFHMPGHKRREDAGFMAGFPNPYSIDITEIDGFDNLHHAEGVLRESMDWAASVYGAGRTYYLVNGSTCGVLAAVCAAVPRGGTILMARNSHKAAYHAAALNELNIRYIYPQIIEDFGLQGGLLPQDVEKMLISADGLPSVPGKNPAAPDKKSGLPAAVFITSPTYDGVMSDVRGIADVCHRHGVPLIVDEAHGAHFPFGEMFPASALEMGADIVIQSLHKTLPAFTQTALLHIGADTGLIDTRRLEYYLQVFQTSSPSYVLMSGIERCIEYMTGDGRDEMRRFAARLAELRGRLRRMDHLRLLDRDVVGSAGVYDLDISKMIISAGHAETRPQQDMKMSVEGKDLQLQQKKNTGKSTTGAGFLSNNENRLSGLQLAEILRRDYHLEMEMCGADYVTAITTLMDSQEGLDRLETALLEIDEKLKPETSASDSAVRALSSAASSPAALALDSAASGPVALAFDSAASGPVALALDSAASSPVASSSGSAAPPVSPAAFNSAALPRPQAVLPIYEAQSRPVRTISFEAAAGCISGEYVYLYPPGTPVVVPGELLTEEVIGVIRQYREQRLPIQGLCDHKAETVRVLI